MGKFKARLFGSAVSIAMLSAALVTLAAAPANAAVSCTNAVTIWGDGNGNTHAVVPGTSSGVTWNAGECHLSEGSSGAGVKAMQRGLNTCYGAGITADGQFGPKTRGAMNWMAFNNSGPLSCRYFSAAS